MTGRFLSEQRCIATILIIREFCMIILPFELFVVLFVSVGLITCHAPHATFLLFSPATFFCNVRYLYEGGEKTIFGGCKFFGIIPDSSYTAVSMKFRYKFS